MLFDPDYEAFMAEVRRLIERLERALEAFEEIISRALEARLSAPEPAREGPNT